MEHVFEQLAVWVDPIARSGAENMAVDEWLMMEFRSLPLIRFYEWRQDEVSFGYFSELAKVRSQFPNVQHFVRRWTGGGVVDHRIDCTYTLVIPRDSQLARLRGAESYGLIHRAVTEALNSCGIPATLTEQDSGNGSNLCFQNPVAYDVVTPSGNKLAGAGQKRTKKGLLHQGSVLLISDELKEQWREVLCQKLSPKNHRVSPAVNLSLVSELVANKYASDSWLEKR